MELSDFHKMVQTVSEYLRANQKPLVNPEISKAIMPRPKLEIAFLKKKSDENRKLLYSQKLSVYYCYKKCKKIILQV